MDSVVRNNFYYIMDYRDHYYRVNSDNQLVVANDKNDATVFSMEEAEEKIGSGLKSRFYFVVPTDEVEVCNHEDCGRDDSDELSYSIADAIVSAARELTDGELPENVEKNISEYDLSVIDWKEYLNHYIYIASNLRNYKESLTNSLSDVDMKICDILHYIELCDVHGEEDELVELLKVCRENRRDIKDQELCIDALMKTIGTSANIAKAKEALKTVKSLDNRSYKPRKFSELFEGSTLKLRSLEERSQAKSKKEMEPEEAKVTSEMEDAEMEYVRRETIFDGRENDWMAFATQQAEFYRNVDQYMTNIQIDIDEIDDEIANLMDEIEKANCNVTQGYKLFKRLKDLRVERKKKDRELESLYILTDHINVQSMAEECELNESELREYLTQDDDTTNEESDPVTGSNDELDDSEEMISDLAV